MSTSHNVPEQTKSFSQLEWLDLYDRLYENPELLVPLLNKVVERLGVDSQFLLSAMELSRWEKNPFVGYHSDFASNPTVGKMLLSIHLAHLPNIQQALASSILELSKET